MDDCRIVTDLLPSYCDDLTSWETNTYIRTHLNTCPGCRKLLEQMQQRQKPQEADIRRAKFKAALEAYEHRHKVRQGIILLIFLGLLIGFFVARAFSFNIAIAAEGLDYFGTVQGPTTNSEGRLYRVVAARTDSGSMALVFLTENFLGFWTVTGVDIADPSRGYDHALMLWTDTTVNYHGTDSAFQNEFHIVYSNNNAKKLIEFPQEIFSGGTIVHVWQEWQYYYIHIVTTEGFSTDITPILKEYGFIS